MTPFEIDIMLHVYAFASPMDMENELRRQTVAQFIGLDLLAVNDTAGAGYALTPRGEAYVGFLMAMPLPVANWTIPGPWNPSLPPAAGSGEE